MTTKQRRTVFLLVVGAAIVWVAYLARDVVTPLLAALLLAYILDPLVKVLERRGISRGTASAGVVVVALLGILLVMTVAARRVYVEGDRFYQDVVGEVLRPANAAPDEGVDAFDDPVPLTDEAWLPVEWDGEECLYLDRNRDGEFQAGYARRGVLRLRALAVEYDVAHYVDDAMDTLGNVGPAVAKGAGGVLRQLLQAGRKAASTGANILTMLILFPIYLYYSLANLSRVYDVTVKHLPADHRERAVDILQKIHVTLSAFFRGRLLTMIGKGLLLLVLFIALDVPFSLVCATFAAIASLVPVVGGLAASAVPLALGISAGFGIGHLGGLAGGMVAVELVEGYVLVPALIGTRVGLHPLTVLVSAFVFGDLLGVFGMLIAIPLTAVLKILGQEIVVPEIRRQAGLLPRAPPAPPTPDEDEP
jgi:predicted PurR-regulated permease PerM